MKIGFTGENKSPEAKKALLVKGMVLITLLAVLFVLISLFINMSFNKGGSSSSSEPTPGEVGEVMYTNLVKEINKRGKVESETHDVKNISSVNFSGKVITVSYIDKDNYYNYISINDVTFSDIYLSSDFAKNKEATHKVKSNNYVDGNIALNGYSNNIFTKGGYVDVDMGYISFIGYKNESTFVSGFNLTYDFNNKQILTDPILNEVSLQNDRYYFSLLTYLSSLVN